MNTLNKNYFAALLIFLLLLSDKTFPSEDITGLVIKEYQAYAEIRLKKYSDKLKNAITNIASQKIYAGFLIKLKKLSVNKFNIDITDYRKLEKIGIDTTKKAAIVFNDIFFNQSFYSIFTLKDESKLRDFIKRNAVKSGHRRLKFSNLIFMGIKITVLKSDERITACFCTLKGKTLFSESNLLLERVISSFKKGEMLKKKPANASFLKSVKNAFVELYLKPAVFSQIMNMSLLLSGNASKVRFNFQTLQAFNSYALGISFNKKLIGIDLYSGIARSNEHAEVVRDVIASTNYYTDIVDYLPKSPYVFFNMNANFDNMLKLISNMFPAFKEKIGVFYKELYKLSGVNIKTQLFNHLGTRVGFSVYSFDPTFFILKRKAISNMDWIAYLQTKDPGGASYAVSKIVGSLKKVYPKTTYHSTFIRGYRFYKVKSFISFYVGIFNTYIIIGTKEKRISSVIKNMLLRRKTGFRGSLKSKIFAKRLEDNSTINFFLNLEKIFGNSILPSLVISRGIILKSLKNLFFSSNITERSVHSILRLYFK